jgi:hypothetical protein
MLDSQDRPMFGHVLRSLAKQTEWISWLVFGAGLGRYLCAQDPIGLAAGIVSFVLIQVGGVACKLFADKFDEGEKRTDDHQPNEEADEEESRPAKHDTSS